MVGPRRRSCGDDEVGREAEPSPRRPFMCYCRDFWIWEDGADTLFSTPLTKYN